MFVIKWKNPQTKITEDIDEADSEETAQYLVGEYQMVYGGGVWYEKQ